MEKGNRPDLENEMDELQRVVQDLSRDEDINVSVDDLVNSFKKSTTVLIAGGKIKVDQIKSVLKSGFFTGCLEFFAETR